MSNNARRFQRNTNNRSYKSDHEERQVTDSKLQRRQDEINREPLKALNKKQQHYIDLINSKNCVVATGLAGSSKTYIPTVMACDMWRLNQIKKIVLVRPAISNSGSIGFLAGSKVDKLKNWLMPVLDTLYKRLGHNVVDLAIESGDIDCVPLEMIKGRSFDKDTFVIVDECEDCTVEEVKSLLTRQGGGRFVLCGDVSQSALRSNSGLKLIKEMADRHHNLKNLVGFVDFNEYSDIVRSVECREWVKAFNKEKV